MRDIKELTVEELEMTLRDWGGPIFHARQIFNWIYKKAVLDFAEMSNLPLELRKRLKNEFYLFSLKLIKLLKSEDGTEKFLFRLCDGNIVEAVSIPTEKRITGCISTQAGCKFSCFFCSSGRAGFKRNLTTQEIIEQVLYLKNKSKAHKLTPLEIRRRRRLTVAFGNLSLTGLTHLVFMGIGEPLDNYINVIRAVRIINSPEELHIAARRITISTCGIIPGIERLSNEKLQIELSISLHAADDKTRSQIMPINKKYPLKDLIRASKDYIKKTGRQLTFEYILIKGINSDLENARNLSKILKGISCKVNIIPANPVQERNIEPPKTAEILLFKNYLLRQGMNVTLRRPRGQDIEAACGQLRLCYEKNIS